MPKPEYELPDFDTLDGEPLGLLDTTDPLESDWVERYLREMGEAPAEDDEVVIPEWLPWDFPDISEQYSA